MAELMKTLNAAQLGDFNANKQLEEWANANYADFVKVLMHEFADESKPIEGRMLAALQLKNSLYGKSSKTSIAYHERWKQLDPASRNVVKDGLLRTFQSGTQQIPHYSAMVAAEVACVELPYQEWPNFVPALTEFIAQASAPALQKAGLECFGFTLERIAEIEEIEDSVNELSSETIDKMLTSIVSCIHDSKPDELRLAALQALKNSLLFVRKNMNVKEERDFIMNNAIMGATRASNPELRCLAYACLDQVADLYYENLKDYMTEIFQLTTNAIQTDPEVKVKMAAIEFWSTVAVVEQQLQDDEILAREAGQAPTGPMCQKYTQLALPQLVPLLLQTLTTQEEHAEEDELGLDSTGGLCLETISQTVEEHIIPLVMPFVQQNINHSDWHFRDAAIVAFAGIMDGPDTEAVRSYVYESIPVLLNKFTDQHETVRQSAVHCISTICRLHVGAIDPAQVNGILKAIMDKLNESPRVAAYACFAIYNIARSFKSTNEEPSNALSEGMCPLLQALFRIMDREDNSEHNLLGNSMEAAAELISASALDSKHILVELLPLINDRTVRALAMPTVSQDDQETKTKLLSSFCIIYNALFQRLSKQEVGPSADQIMESLLKIGSIPNISCLEDVYMAIGSLSNVMEEGFIKYLSHVIPFVLEGIKNHEATAVSKVSIGCLVDICSSVAGGIQPYCDNIMSVLTDMLHDTTVYRGLKPPLISCLGDIAMAICGAYEPYLQITTMLLMQAAQQSAPSDNEDLIDFINTLRCAVLEAYSGILLGLSDGNKLQLFAPNVQQLGLFLEWLTNPTSLRDETVLPKAVTLLGDIAREMPTDPQVKALVTQQFVQPLLNSCAEVGAEGASAANWANEQIQAALQQG